MNRTPFAVYRQIRLAVTWYGSDYAFFRDELNQYQEPTGENTLVQTVTGIYHSTDRSFIELINTEGASVKSKISRGILCSKDNNLTIQQGDYTQIQNVPYYVTAIEPVLYSDEVVGYEISVEELIEGNDES